MAARFVFCTCLKTSLSLEQYVVSWHLLNQLKDTTGIKEDIQLFQVVSLVGLSLATLYTLLININSYIITLGIAYPVSMIIMP